MNESLAEPVLCFQVPGKGIPRYHPNELDVAKTAKLERENEKSCEINKA